MVDVVEKPKGKRGGKRVGAGRPKSGRRVGPAHRMRPDLLAKHPVHVSLKLRERHPDLRTRDYYHAIRRVLATYLGREDIRFVHASVQNTHLHFLVEAESKHALTRGMRSLTVALSYAIGGGRSNTFRERYHATQIKTPRQARNTLAYVLNNWRRHREDCVSLRHFDAPVDPYSSGVTFAGWTGRPAFTLPAGYAPLPMAAARTELLKSSWRRFGLIDPFERPGPQW
jgi:REP element-mobilizing transposase RayT